jgi:hypothetical protein
LQLKHTTFVREFAASAAFAAAAAAAAGTKAVAAAAETGSTERIGATTGILFSVADTSFRGEASSVIFAKSETKFSVAV